MLLRLEEISKSVQIHWALLTLIPSLPSINLDLKRDSLHLHRHKFLLLFQNEINFWLKGIKKVKQKNFQIKLATSSRIIHIWHIRHIRHIWHIWQCLSNIEFDSQIPLPDDIWHLSLKISTFLLWNSKNSHIFIINKPLVN